MVPSQSASLKDKDLVNIYISFVRIIGAKCGRITLEEGKYQNVDNQSRIRHIMHMHSAQRMRARGGKNNIAVSIAHKLKVPVP